MITALRRLFGSTLGKFFALAFVLLVGLAFALGDVTGSGSFGGVGCANVARVGSSEIGLGELRDRVRLASDHARQAQPTLTMAALRSEAHTPERQSLIRRSSADYTSQNKQRIRH